MIIYGVFAFLFGTVFGSFYNCMAMRVAVKEDFVKGRSHCMSCGHELSAPDLVPLLSWILSGGKCRYCGAKVSVRYPLTEALFGLLTLVLFQMEIGDPLYAGAGEWIRFVRDFLLAGMLFSLSIVDLMIYEIPNGMLLTALLAWVVTAPFLYTLKAAGLSVLAGFVIGAGMLLLSMAMDRILKKDSLGGGDIKLFALLGLYTGFFGDYIILVFSVIFGLLTILITRKNKIPWGPSIAAGGYIALLFGDGIFHWYLGITGLA